MLNCIEARKTAKRMLGRRRYRHSVGVARAAKSLARRYGGDARAAALAGYLHDIAKEFDEEKLKKWAADPALEGIIDEKWAHPVLHAFAGAAYAKSVLKIDDDRIISAIRWHTTAKAGMSQLEKIIYVADFISADRTYDICRSVRKTAKRSLDAAYGEELSYTVKKLKSKNAPIVPITLEAYAELNERKQTNDVT